MMSSKLLTYDKTLNSKLHDGLRERTEKTNLDCMLSICRNEN